MSNKTGIAILGVGRWGVHLLRNFLAHPQAQVVAVIDPHQDRLERCKEQFKLDESVYLSTEWLDVLQRSDVEALAIATPATTHYQLISSALQHGLHVFTEKPLTIEPTQAAELCRLAAQQQRQLFVDHTYLFHPAVEAGKNAIESQRLGNLRYGYAARTHLGPVRLDVDAMWDLAIHDIAIFNNWLGQLPVEVQATGTTWLQQSQGLADLVWCRLRYADGFQCSIHLCWGNPDKQRRLAVVGSQGTLIFDELQSSPLVIQRGNFEDQNGFPYTPVNQSREVIDLTSGEPLARVCDRFLNSIRDNTPCPISSGWVGTQLVQILTCLSESLQQEGKPVKIPQLSRLDGENKD